MILLTVLAIIYSRFVIFSVATRITVGVPVLIRESSGTLNTCAQLFEGRSTQGIWSFQRTSGRRNKDYDFDDGIVPKENMPDLPISKLDPKGLQCSNYRFKDSSADIIVVFPGGKNRNCTGDTGRCNVIIAQPSEGVLTIGKSFCYDLFVGSVHVPNEEALLRDSKLSIIDISGVASTCNPETFMNLIQEKVRVENLKEEYSEMSLKIKRKVLLDRNQVKENSLEPMEPKAEPNASERENLYHFQFSQETLLPFFELLCFAAGILGVLKLVRISFGERSRSVHRRPEIYQIPGYLRNM